MLAVFNKIEIDTRPDELRDLKKTEKVFFPEEFCLRR